MSTQPLRHSPMSNPHNPHLRWWLGLGLAVVLALVAINAYTYVSTTPTTNVASAGYVDPAGLGIMGYVQAHSSIPLHAPTADPATQAVASYIQAHANVTTYAAVSAATQGIAGYLNAHNAVKAAALTADPAAQAVMSYIQAHAQW